jgi:hypothetical protein
MLVVYGVVVWRSRLLRDAAPWLRRGTVDRGTWVAVASFVAVSASALVVWRFGAGYDVSAFESFVPRLEVPTWLFFVGLWPFAMLNAAAEELLFRGVLFEGLQRWPVPPWTVNLLQAASFGLAHYLGFPGGWIGVGLATIYGLMMGHLRQRTGGLWIPWIAHVFADVTIYSMVVAMALP